MLAVREPAARKELAKPSMADDHRLAAQLTDLIRRGVLYHDLLDLFIGIARDKKGKKLFICKDSWGNNLQGGFMYLDEDYVRAKTVGVVIPTAALPPALGAGPFALL